MRRMTQIASAGTFVTPGNIEVADFASSWWVTPKAVESGGRVFFTGLTAAGSVKIYSVSVSDHGDVDQFTLGACNGDDHDGAAIIVPDDKVPLVFRSLHNDDTLLRYRKGTAIGDVTSMGSESTISLAGDTTYSQAWQRPAPNDDEVHWFARENVSTPRYWVNTYSEDYADTWSTPRRVFDFGVGEQGYIATVPTASDGDVLRVALYGHPTSSTIHDVYVCLIDMGTGAITDLSGATIGNLKSGSNLPLTVTSLEVAVNTDTAGGHNCRLFDVSDGDDFEIAFEDWTSDTNAIYCVTTWNGSSWSSESLVAAGVTFGYLPSIHYNGGMAFPRATAGGIVYLSREASGTWYIEKWARSGAWSASEIASGASKIVRPFPVINPTRGKIAWMNFSNYTALSDASLTWDGGTVVRG